MHTPYTLALTKRNAGNATKRSEALPVLDLVKYHEYPTPAPVQVKRKKRKRKPSGTGNARWSEIVGNFDPAETRKRLVVKSSEIRPPVVRASDGAKNSDPAVARRGQAMRDQVQANWDTSQAPYGLKPIHSDRKIGAGK